MTAENFYQKVDEIISKDSRYKPDAYEFVMQALLFAQKASRKKGHLSGKELLEGIKTFALDQYGPMAKTVFSHWGINSTNDFGAIVFNMVDKGLMSKTEDDSLSDFKDVYDFNEAFDAFNAGGNSGKKK